MVLNAGPSRIGVESTIIDLTGPSPQLLRPGGVSLEMLRPYLPDLVYTPSYLEAEDALAAPGMMLRHYSPSARLVLFQADADDVPDTLVIEAMVAAAEDAISSGERVGVMVQEAYGDAFDFLPLQIAGLGQDDTTMASQLFAGMRELDSASVDLILAQSPERHGLGLAIRDRLLRAANGHVVTVVGDASPGTTRHNDRRR